MTDMILVYITCESAAQAKKIGMHLLKKRLTACINVIPKTQPAYFWPPKTGKIEEAKESVLLVKTLQSKYESVEKEIRKLHSFETPCILALPIVNMNEDYYKWLKEEIR